MAFECLDDLPLQLSVPVYRRRWRGRGLSPTWRTAAAVAQGGLATGASRQLR